MHKHEKHSHHHIHRGIKEIKEIIHAGNLTENAERLAVKIFTILAEAEAKAHNVPSEEVHFHEVGAVDSIVAVSYTHLERKRTYDHFYFPQARRDQKDM